MHLPPPTRIEIVLRVVTSGDVTTPPPFVATVKQQQEQRDAARFGRPIGDFLDDYRKIRHSLKLNPEHVEKYAHEVERAALALGWVTPTDATTTQIRLYLAGLKGQGGAPVSPQWYNLVRCALATFFSHCVEAGAIDANPAEPIPCLPIPKRSKVAGVTEEWLERLCAAVVNRRGGQDAADYYRVCFWTGLRPGSPEKLRVHHIDLGACPAVCVPEGFLKKNSEPYRIEIVTPALFEIFQRRCGGKKPMDKVFPNAAPDAGQFVDDINRAGLTRKSPDGKRILRGSLRHGRATVMAAAGVPPAIAQRQLGHSDVKLTLGYYPDPTLLQSRKILAEKLGAHGKSPDEGLERLDRSVSGGILNTDPDGGSSMTQIQGGIGRRPESGWEDLNLSPPRQGESGTLPTPHSQTCPSPLYPEGLRTHGPGRGCAPEPTGTGVAFDFASVFEHAAGLLAAAARAVRGGGA